MVEHENHALPMVTKPGRMFGFSGEKKVTGRNPCRGSVFEEPLPNANVGNRIEITLSLHPVEAGFPVSDTQP